MKKQVYAYLHTHWDREWYRDKEEFNLRLLEVFDEVLNELEAKKAPCFYFDGQTAALEDYLKYRPEKKEQIKRFIKERKLFIGPFFASADSFLTGAACLKKNLEIGLKYSRELGEKQFTGYLSDTFGHSAGMAKILKCKGISDAIIWRGTGNIPSEFVFCGLNTTRLVEGYFNDALQLDVAIEKRAQVLEGILEKIEKYSDDTLLLPIGADHLGILKNATKTVNEVNKHLKNFEITLSSPFEYFKAIQLSAKNRTVFDREFLDNSANYTLPGVYSSRIYQKVKNAKLQWELSRIVEPLNALTESPWGVNIEAAYKELIKNHAHDSLYGCSIDPVHEQVDARFQKVESILNGIKKRILREQKAQQIGVFNLSNFPYTGVVRVFSEKKIKNGQIIKKTKGFSDKKLYDRTQIPVTEDITTLYEYLVAVEDLPPFSFSDIEPQKVESGLKVSENELSNKNISLKVESHKVFVDGVELKLTDQADEGDSYNFAPTQEPLEIPLLNAKVVEKGDLRCVLRLKYENITLDAILTHGAKHVEFECKINNKTKNHRLCVAFEFEKPLNSTVAEDTVGLVEREHDPNYSLLEEIRRVHSDPKLQKRQELKTNSYPMQRFVWAQGKGILTLGLNDYEVYQNTLSVTLLRGTGLISNPKNPARLVSAGPPLAVPKLQCLGEQKVKFAFCTQKKDNVFKIAEEFYGATVAFQGSKTEGERTFMPPRTKTKTYFKSTGALLYGLQKEGKSGLVGTFYNPKDTEAELFGVCIPPYGFVEAAVEE